jgi:hypothetical protein
MVSMMTDFDVEDVTLIARDAAREHSPSVTVAGVVLGAGGSDYDEWRHRARQSG